MVVTVVVEVAVMVVVVVADSGTDAHRDQRTVVAVMASGPTSERPHQ